MMVAKLNGVNGVVGLENSRRMRAVESRSEKALAVSRIGESGDELLCFAGS